MEIIFYISNAISIIFIGQVGKVWGSGVGGNSICIGRVRCLPNV